MRCTLILSLALAAGCASNSSRPTGAESPAGKTAEGPTPQRAIFSTISTLRATYADIPGASESVVRAEPAAVRESIRKMFKLLEIPLTVDDPKQDAIGNTDFQKIARVGNHPMTQLVDCGSSAIGPRAATHRMYMSLVSIVDSLNPRSARVKTTLTASARDMSGNDNTRLHCGSTGALERIISDSVTAFAER